MIRVVCSLILAVAVLTACKKEKHFLTDETYRKTVLQDFEGKKLLLSDAPENLFAVFDEPMTLEEREALQFCMLMHLWLIWPGMEGSFY